MSGAGNLYDIDGLDDRWPSADDVVVVGEAVSGGGDGDE